MIDRSQFIDELRRNPDLVHRLAVINAGEVGRAPLEKQILQLETIFNRAIARGQTLEEVTKQYTGPGSKGYYPGSTFKNGEAAMAKPGALDAFREKVFRPVVDGSDVSTRKLGFAATGNASDSGKNRYGEPYATGRAARGEYARTRWYEGGEKTAGKLDEMYVQEKGTLDRNERLDALRKGGPEPQPDPNAPAPAAAATAPRSTGNLLADHVAGTPWEPTPEQQSALVTGVPSTQSTPAPTVTPAPAQTQSARTAPRPAAPLAPKGFPGSRDSLPYDYIDPNTGHRIVNPKGSGEQAMGLTRDIGPPPRAISPSRTAAPAAAAKPAEEFSPRSVTSDFQRTSPPEQVARPDERSSVAPFDQSAMDPTLLPQQRPIDLGPKLDEGPTPPSAISGAPGAAQVAAMAPPQADFLSTLFQNLSRVPDRPLGTQPATAAPMSPFEPGGRTDSFPFPPAQARSPIGQNFNDASRLPKGFEDPSAISSFGGARQLNMSPARTVDQELRGASLAPTGLQVAGGGDDFMAKALNDFANMGLPPSTPRRGSNLSPPGTQLYPQSSSPNDLSLKFQPPSPMGRDLGLGGVQEPPVRAFDRMRDPMGGYPPAAMPRQDQMAAGGSATQPTPQQAAAADLQSDPQRDPQSFDTAMQGNLSPFQEWPPPWWGDGYNSFGGGGFDFGGGGDWGGGSYGGEGFASYGDFGLGSYG